MITVTAEFKFVIQYTNSRNSMNFVHLHGIMVIDIKCGVHQQGNSIVVKLGKEVIRQVHVMPHVLSHSHLVITSVDFASNNEKH